MIVDGKGKIFEDRRKENSKKVKNDRRKETQTEKKKSMHHLLEIVLNKLQNLKKNYKKLK